MNTWIVGNHPVGHLKLPYDQKKMARNEKGVVEVGERTFFMKARIMTGQADLSQNKLGLSDFRWLAKEEVQKLVEQRYFSDVKNMLPDR